MGGIWVFCNGDRGEAVLRAIAGQHRVTQIIVPPAKRGRFVALAGEIGAGLLSPDKVNDPAWLAPFAHDPPDLAIVAGFSTIFRQPLIDFPQQGAINLHAGPVPSYRGGSPLNWQIINGEAEIGISILRMTAGIDDGPLLASRQWPLLPQDDIASTHAKANVAFAGMVLDLLASSSGDRFTGTVQDDARGRYWLQRNDRDGEINWQRMSALQVHNLVRALTKPYPGAWSGERRIWRTSLDGLPVHGRAGRVAYVQGQGPFVCCGDGRGLLVLDYSGPELSQGEMI